MDMLKNYKSHEKIKNKVSDTEIIYRISYVSILMYHTNHGTSLPFYRFY